MSPSSRASASCAYESVTVPRVTRTVRFAAADITGFTTASGHRCSSSNASRSTTAPRDSHTVGTTRTPARSRSPRYVFSIFHRSTHAGFHTGAAAAKKRVQPLTELSRVTVIVPGGANHDTIEPRPIGRRIVPDDALNPRATLRECVRGQPVVVGQFPVLSGCYEGDVHPDNDSSKRRVEQVRAATKLLILAL